MKLKILILISVISVINHLTLLSDVEVANATPFPAKLHVKFRENCKTSADYDIDAGRRVTIEATKNCYPSSHWAEVFEKINNELKVGGVLTEDTKDTNQLGFVTDFWTGEHHTGERHIYGPIIDKSKEPAQTMYRISASVQ
jgi:hypothetical protein